MKEKLKNSKEPELQSVYKKKFTKPEDNKPKVNVKEQLKRIIPDFKCNGSLANACSLLEHSMVI